MATIEIIGWKEDPVGFSAWNTHARSELTKRLRRGLRGSPAEIRRLARHINARKPVCLSNVHDDSVHGITQILEITGADFRVSIENSSGRELFRRILKR